VLRDRVARIWRTADFDRVDAVLAIGLVLLAGGVWAQFSGPWAAIIAGAVLTGFGIRGALK